MMTQTDALAPETALRLLADASIMATAAIYRARPAGLAREVDALRARPDYDEALCAALRAELRARLDTVLAEWREAAEAMVGEGVLRALMNAQANEIAVGAVRRADAEVRS